MICNSTDKEPVSIMLSDVEEELLRAAKRIGPHKDERVPKYEKHAIYGTGEHDNVYHPAHYEVGNYECIKVMEAIFGCDYVFHFCVCNAFKYLWRYKRKNGFEDLEKARWYLTKALELSENMTLQAKDAQ